MPPSHPNDDDDRRLGEAIEGYLSRLQRGETISVDQWVGQFPDLADELRECLSALPLLQEVAANEHHPQDRDRPGADDDIRAGLLGLARNVDELPSIRGYTMVEEVGRGGMGVVYRAEQHSTRRLVALKLLASGPYASPAARRRFVREIELVAGLDHPGLVRVLEAGESPAGLYCAMEFVDGCALNTYLVQNRLNLAEKLEVFLQIVRAVQYAHQRAVIHRDLKPSNILVDERGRARILDFGLARLDPQSDSGMDLTLVTQEGQLVGTLPYLSPEQAAGAGRGVDTRSDLYALGVILYEMLTGRAPYETGPTLEAALHNIGHTIPRRPSSFCKELSADTDAVALKLLEKSLDDRYQTAAEVVEDVRCLLQHEPVEANRSTRFHFLRKAYARHRTQFRLAAAAASLLLLVSVVILALYIQVRRERNRLAEQLYVSSLQRGLAHLAAGHDLLAEDLLRSAYLQRPADARGYWSLLSYFVQNPLLRDIPRTGWVTALAYSLDGRLLACGNLDGTVAVYAETSLQPVVAVSGHHGAVSQLQFAPTGNLLASGGSDGSLKLWNAETGALLRAIDAHPGGVTGLNFVGMERLVSSGNDGRVLQWTHEDKAPLETIYVTKQQSILASDVSANGEWIAIATADKRVRIVDMGQRNLLTELGDFPEPARAVRFAPDAATVAVWCDATLSVWEVPGGTLCWTDHAGLAEPQPASLWLHSPKPHYSWVPSLTYSPDGSLLASGGWDAVTRFWGAKSGEKRGVLRANGTAVYAVAFQNDGHQMATGCVGAIRVWDLASHAAKAEVAADTRDLHPLALSMSADFAAWSEGSAVMLMKLTYPHETRAWKTLDAPLQAIAVDDQGRQLATADDEARISIWGVADGALLQCWQASSRVRALAFSPDGARVATGDLNGTLELRGSADGGCEQSWTAHRGRVQAIAFAPDGKQILTGGTDWHAKLWQVGEDEAIADWPHLEWVNVVTFSPDGSRIATGGADLILRVGQPKNTPELQVRTAHAHWINGLAFLDEGRVLVTAGNDAAVRFWDASTGQELASLPSHWGAVQSLAATADSRYLAIAAQRGIQLVDLGMAKDCINREMVDRRRQPHR